jgi:hypothetical protein
MKLRMPNGHPPAGDPKEITAFADSILRGGAPLTKLLGQGRDQDTGYVCCQREGFEKSPAWSRMNLRPGG